MVIQLAAAYGVYRMAHKSHLGLGYRAPDSRWSVPSHCL